jgi:uncharacterized protein YceK
VKTILAWLIILLMASGCTTVRHPHAPPGVAYDSLEICYAQHLDDGPAACRKTLDRAATVQAIGVGAQVVLVLTYVGLLALAIAGAR